MAMASGWKAQCDRCSIQWTGSIRVEKTSPTLDSIPCRNAQAQHECTTEELPFATVVRDHRKIQLCIAISMGSGRVILSMFLKQLGPAHAAGNEVDVAEIFLEGNSCIQWKPKGRKPGTCLPQS